MTTLLIDLSTKVLAVDSFATIHGGMSENDKAQKSMYSQCGRYLFAYVGAYIAGSYALKVLSTLVNELVSFEKIQKNFGASSGVVMASETPLAIKDWHTRMPKSEIPYEMVLVDTDLNSLMYFSSDSGLPFFRLNQDTFQSGSGGRLALAAYMACGDIKKSMDVACKLDRNSGGEIVVYEW